MAEDLISIALPRSPALLLISAILVVFVLSYVAYQRFLSPLAGTPGPFVASLSKLWTARQAWQANFHKTLHALHERHGDLVRIAPNQVSTINPEAIRKIYNPSADHTKGSFYGVLGGKRKFDLVSKSDEKTHAFQRRLVARTYTTEAVKSLEPVVNEMIEKLVKRLDSMHDRSFDINHIVRLFTFDVITAMTFSKDFNAIESGQDNGVGKPMYAMFSSASWVCHLPWLVKVHNACMPFIGNWLGLNQRNTALRDFAVVEVEDRKANKDEPDRPDFLSKFFAIHRERPHDFTEEDFISQASTHFSAGFDTTWISICGIIFELLKNPTTKQKLLQELNNAVAAGKLSDPPLFTELLQLPYLQAAMYEGMRLHPAVGFMLQRVVPAAGLDINGTYLPAGVSQSQLHETCRYTNAVMI